MSSTLSCSHSYRLNRRQPLIDQSQSLIDQSQSLIDQSQPLIDQSQPLIDQSQHWVKIPVMLKILPKDIINMVFMILPITAKRNFIRCDKELNLFTSLMATNEEKIMTQIKIKYEIYLPFNLTKIEQYTLEMIYDNCEHLIPNKYIRKDNKLCYENKIMYLYCATPNNISLLKKLLNLSRLHCDYIIYGAAGNGHLDMLKWALKNGCTRGSFDNSTMFSFAAANGHLHVIKWAWENGYKWDNFSFSYAALHGHLNILKWALENDEEKIKSFSILPLRRGEHRWGNLICSSAAYNGHLNVLIWARGNGFNWDYWTCCNAAHNGYLHVLKWARENGCEWNSDTCCDAAKNGHLDVLKWARGNGCDWNSETCIKAAQNGHLDVLKWARENGCDWNSYVCKYAFQQGHLDVLQWAREQGCPE